LRVGDDFFTTCIPIRAYSSYRWQGCTQTWSTVCRIRSALRGKGLLPVPCSLRRRFMDFAIFCGGHPTRMRNPCSRPAPWFVLYGAAGCSAGDLPAERWRIVDCREANRRRDIARGSHRHYRALVHSGAPIAEINAVRKHLSAVKRTSGTGGFPRSRCRCWCPTFLTHARRACFRTDDARFDDGRGFCHRVAEKYDLLKQFPQSTRELFERHALEETPKSTIRHFSARAGGPC